MSIETGTVKWFNNDKGYGFITPDSGEKDLFVHFSNVVGSGYRTLNENDKVSFIAEQTDRGLSATDVEVIA